MLGKLSLKSNCSMIDVIGFCSLQFFGVCLNHQVTLDEFAQLIESPKLRFWMSQLDSWTASCAELRLCLCRGFLVRRTAA